MKISGLLPVIVIAVIWYCACNSIILNPVDVIADVGDTVISSRRGYKGPFGIDSQKILNSGASAEYEIGIVAAIDLEKNDDGTWYVYNCQLVHSVYNTLYFASPHPQRYDLNIGDFVAFTAELASIVYDGKKRYFYNDGKILDHISSQSAKFSIDGISGLSTPSDEVPPLAREEDWHIVTGVIMAIETTENMNPEPDNPTDYLISKAVMKTADGDLYIADFSLGGIILGAGTGRFQVNHPSDKAFGEGDIVSVMQISNVENLSFSAYYKKFIVKKKRRTETIIPPVNPNINPDQGTETQEPASRELISKASGKGCRI